MTLRARAPSSVHYSIFRFTIEEMRKAHLLVLLSFFFSRVAFVDFHNLNVGEMLEPLDSFKTFNEFFYRKLKPGARKVASEDPRVAVSPADCRMMVFPTISEATR